MPLAAGCIGESGSGQRPGARPGRGGGGPAAGGRQQHWQGGGGGGRQYAPDPSEKGSSQKLCARMKGVGIACSITAVGDGHTWQSATAALTSALPAVAGRLGA